MMYIENFAEDSIISTDKKLYLTDKLAHAAMQYDGTKSSPTDVMKGGK
jgi:7-keto-8-aminopelargonate synthetase-like enzyme